MEEDASDDDGMDEYLDNFGPSDNEDADEETVSELLNQLALVSFLGWKLINTLYAVITICVCM